MFVIPGPYPMFVGYISLALLLSICLWRGVYSSRSYQEPQEDSGASPS